MTRVVKFVPRQENFGKELRGGNGKVFFAGSPFDLFLSNKTPVSDKTLDTDGLCRKLSEHGLTQRVHAVTAPRVQDPHSAGLSPELCCPGASQTSPTTSTSRASRSVIWPPILTHQSRVLRIQTREGSGSGESCGFKRGWGWGRGGGQGSRTFGCVA